MKYRESGMPSEQIWNTFFDPQQTLIYMGIDSSINTLLDIGCGYGTFLIPSSNIINGTVVGMDIDKEMIKACKVKAHQQGISNIELICGDIVNENMNQHLDKYRGTIDYITLFNILHCEHPLNLLKRALDIINKNGRIGVIHWNYEKTPRGPSMEIRPTPETIIDWAIKTGLSLEKHVELPPYHFGLVFRVS